VIFSDKEAVIERLLSMTGDDVTREGLKETPSRVVKAFEHWFDGYGQDPAAVLKTFEDGAEGSDEMVLETDIPINSKCEHHMADIFGIAHIAYIPNGRVVGLSKLSRVVDIFAHRLQVQERLTTQIADALQEHLAPKGVGVVLQCRHMCMESRGIKRRGIVTTTSALRGCMKKEPSARAELMNLIAMTSKGDI
jgi:GTP cyclohydrolase I